MRNRLTQMLAILLSLNVLAQQPPAQQPSAQQSSFDRWRASRLDIYLNDFGELSRYREENAHLQAPAPSESRVVFFGDSITDNWRLADYFPGKPYLNRGISGQTTSQMLVRFQQDVIALRPKVVVILAGTNDLAGNTGPIRPEDIEANYASLAELAAANKIKVVFSSVLPVNNYSPESQEYFTQRPPEKILQLNRWLAAYCAAHGCFYLDYFNSLVDSHGLLQKDLADDGLHPNPQGYKIMAPLAEAAIHSALSGLHQRPVTKS